VIDPNNQRGKTKTTNQKQRITINATNSNQTEEHPHSPTQVTIISHKTPTTLLKTINIQTTKP